jgi:hypothetical protein
MLADLKKPLKAITLELRHLLEGRYENDGSWTPGDLETAVSRPWGFAGDRTAAPVDELGHLSPEDRRARCVVGRLFEAARRRRRCSQQRGG